MKSRNTQVFSLVSVIIAVALILPWTAMAGNLECSEVGTWNLPFSENAKEIIISGNTAYVAATYDGLVIYDITEPHNPVKLGQLKDGYNEEAYNLAIAGNYAYVTYYDDGLKIIDISNPEAPSLTGTYPSSDTAKGIDVAGNYAYVAINDGGLEIIDISTPATPTLAGSYPTSEYMYDVVVRGNYAFVAEYRDGLLILDISNPAAPAFMGRCDTDNYVEGVEVDGDYAYLADGSDGLQIVDISTLSAPVIVGTHETADSAKGVFISDDYAYVAIDYAGLEIVDISIKTAPVQAGIVDTERYAKDVFVSSGVAYVADSESVAVIDVSSPTAPILEKDYNPSGDIKDVFAVGDLLYLASGKSGLQILDGSDPQKLVRLGGCLATGSVERIFVQGSFAYVALTIKIGWDDEEYSMHIFDISDSSNPVQLGHLPARDTINDIYVRPPYAYVADAGLRVVDISDPAAPIEVGFRSTSRAMAVWVSGDIAYVADYSSGIRIIDIQNPFTPTLLTTYSTGKAALNLLTSGEELYVAYNSAGMEVVDISDPTTPTRLGSYDTPGLAYDIQLSGELALVADYQRGLQVIDAQTPTNLVLAGSCTSEGLAMDLTVANGYAYLRYEENDESGVIKIFQISSTNAAVAACTPDRFELATNKGQSPASVSFKIMNAGSGTLNYAVASDAAWITPQPTSGTSSGESDTITLTFSTAGLSAGWHAGTVTVTEAGALNSPFPIPVELWVEPLPLAIATSTLPAGTEMVPYSETLGATGGMPPYLWTQISDWPDGLTNAVDGSVAGTPILAGTYSATVEVMDARGKTTSQSVSVQIQPNPNRPPVISSTAPSAGTFPMAEQTNQLFSVTATDPEAASLSYSWTLDGTPVGTDSSTYTFNTVWGDVGTYELEVLISDGFWDTVIAAWTIEVTDDNDGDGIPNDFENTHPLLSAWDAADGAADTDGDHLDNLGEYLAGTLLDNPDCDSDSLPDGWEVRYGFDPLDDPGGLSSILCTLEKHWNTESQYGCTIFSLTVQDNYLYAGTSEYQGSYGSKGFWVFDITTPASTFLKGSWKNNNGSYYRKIVLAGNYAYASQDGVGINIMNISNPSAPSRAGLVSGAHRGLDIDGNYLYSTDNNEGLKNYNLNNPVAPALISPAVPKTSYSYDLAKRGDYVYLVYGPSQSLKVIDVSDPAAPTEEASLKLSYRTTLFAIEIKDNYAYLAGGEAGMHVVDISVPTNPVQVATYNTPGSAYDIHVVGNYAYIADYESFLLVMDISDPTAPRQVGSYNAGNQVYTAQCKDNMVYVGGAGGLHVVKCTSEDTDADGMLDAWEMDQWGNLDRTGLDDFDSDGISDLGEFRAGLNPKNDDEDGDGMIDGDEIIIHNSDPRTSDSDGDGISDSDELICGTDPGNPDDVLQFTETTPNSSTLAIVWQSIPGHDYRVEYCTDLASNIWYTAASSIGATSNTCTYTDPAIPSQPLRYYRVIALP